MHEEKRLPMNKKEGLLYGIVICGITASSMCFYNLYLAFGAINQDMLIAFAKSLPLFFVIAMLLENFVVRHFADSLVKKFSDPKDSFNATLLFTILFTVVGMSFLMTFIGDVVGHGLVVNSSTFIRFVMSWPRNFGVVLGLELLIAQPIARKVMVLLHSKQVEEYVEYD
ncbi:DUF2798 domain-containing protein [Vagococcus martis]|uniref:DUF2798 domain-containing protein n=1 Tax=Vagococcus martis TaxID=1768210 RepID=A0A1V4DFW8_9ENTE|nr:DUF2798 domain-containing protein [Vagococcus martis]OPF87353.1 DUF2798 domain-containing protein [Vagococcus martis]